MLSKETKRNLVASVVSFENELNETIINYYITKQNFSQEIRGNMSKIELEHVDRLNELIREMEVIIYLHDLSSHDIEYKVSMKEELNWTHRSLDFYLLGRYKDTVARMREYVNSDCIIERKEDW